MIVWVLFDLFLIIKRDPTSFLLKINTPIDNVVNTLDKTILQSLTVSLIIVIEIIKIFYWVFPALSVVVEHY